MSAQEESLRLGSLDGNSELWLDSSYPHKKSQAFSESHLPEETTPFITAKGNEAKRLLAEDEAQTSNKTGQSMDVVIDSQDLRKIHDNNEEILCEVHDIIKGEAFMELREISQAAQAAAYTGNAYLSKQIIPETSLDQVAKSLLTNPANSNTSSSESQDFEKSKTAKVSSLQSISEDYKPTSSDHSNKCLKSLLEIKEDVREEFEYLDKRLPLELENEMEQNEIRIESSSVAVNNFDELEPPSITSTSKYQTKKNQIHAEPSVKSLQGNYEKINHFSQASENASLKPFKQTDYEDNAKEVSHIVASCMQISTSWIRGIEKNVDQAYDILKYFLEQQAEASVAIQTDFLALHPVLNAEDRQKVIKWIQKVVKNVKEENDITFRATFIMDMCLCHLQSLTSKADLYLIGICSVYLACQRANVESIEMQNLINQCPVSFPGEKLKSTLQAAHSATLGYQHPLSSLQVLDIIAPLLSMSRSQILLARRAVCVSLEDYHTAEYHPVVQAMAALEFANSKSKSSRDKLHELINGANYDFKSITKLSNRLKGLYFFSCLMNAVNFSRELRYTFEHFPMKNEVQGPKTVR